ncbi:Acyl-CoA synthetase (AMP-forming)/AMP-acid ligase II [Amycolatopsis arida]|uniref:Acyl-CoA synthetase (AMP-forming)/AMP-acid ligase II n=1 Tax=Amycolatopsis arida TaxID=587909 RepID=A0A1I5WPU3_9PSEU|nr:AMP-binding protein [Amycolatopsis arida]TDX92389.1 acyl-CoA synthetase (AMP-forming)/AMP-acid ligase II [Amycolatopsis arida]SFQ21793.1 Acyl-CoA synthetase (AMP-forming)/AMP-acid ligase II [Amycolatopsis arida]
MTREFDAREGEFHVRDGARAGSDQPAGPVVPARASGAADRSASAVGVAEPASVFLTRMLDALAAAGDRVAFVHRGLRIRYRAADRLLRRLHAALTTAGVRAGETVALVGGNRPETVLAQLAAQCLGATVLLVGASTTRPDRPAAVAAGGATTLVLDPECVPDPADLVELVRAARPARVLSLGPLPGARNLLATGAPTPHPPHVSGDSTDSAAPATASPRDTRGTTGSTTPTVPRALPGTVRTLFTSGGTTGAPKLVAHSGIYAGMAHIFRPDPAGPGRVLVVAPVSHLTGNAAVLGALLRGDTVVLHDEFDPAAALAAIAAERVTALSLTPPRLAALLDHPALAGTDLSGLRSLSLGASPLPERRLRQALAVFGPVVGQGYGLTEAPMVASITAAELLDHPRRLGSVGRIVPGMEARIDGARAPGDVGEVLVRGLALMEGYAGRPDLTAAAFTGGWLRTGDLGRFDADGYLYLLDRADDVIVTGEHGSKVYPAVVEDTLADHPGVRQAAVVGAPGPEGALVHAVVVPTEPDPPPVEDLRAHVLARLGQEHLVPATVTFTDRLPLTPVGKIDRRALRP